MKGEYDNEESMFELLIDVKSTMLKNTGGGENDKDKTECTMYLQKSWGF